MINWITNVTLIENLVIIMFQRGNRKQLSGISRNTMRDNLGLVEEHHGSWNLLRWTACTYLCPITPHQETEVAFLKHDIWSIFLSVYKNYFLLVVGFSQTFKENEIIYKCKLNHTF